MPNNETKPSLSEDGIGTCSECEGHGYFVTCVHPEKTTETCSVCNGTGRAKLVADGPAEGIATCTREKCAACSAWICHGCLSCSSDCGCAVPKIPCDCYFKENQVCDICQGVEPAAPVVQPEFRSDRALLTDILNYCRARPDNHEKFNAAIDEACRKVHGFAPYPSSRLISSQPAPVVVPDETLPLTAGDFTREEWKAAEARVFAQRVLYNPDSLSAIYKDIAITMQAKLDRLTAQPAPLPSPATFILQGQRDALFAVVKGIANANWREWGDGLNTPQDFVAWSKSIASRAVEDVEKIAKNFPPGLPSDQKETK